MVQSIWLPLDHFLAQLMGVVYVEHVLWLITCTSAIYGYFLWLFWLPKLHIAGYNIIIGAWQGYIYLTMKCIVKPLAHTIIVSVLCTKLILVLTHDFRVRYLELPPTHRWGMYHCMVSFGRGLGTRVRACRFGKHRAGYKWLRTGRGEERTSLSAMAGRKEWRLVRVRRL